MQFPCLSDDRLGILFGTIAACVVFQGLYGKQKEMKSVRNEKNGEVGVKNSYDHSSTMKNEKTNKKIKRKNYYYAYCS